MTNTEYLISIIILFTAIISPALIVGFIAEYISKRKN